MKLKIKDDVDLKELAIAYNFIYCQNWNIPYECDNYGNLVFENSLYINWREDWIVPKGTIKVSRYGEIDKVIALLFDLIQAGLVEKVEEENEQS